MTFKDIVNFAKGFGSVYTGDDDEEDYLDKKFKKLKGLSTATPNLLEKYNTEVVPLARLSDEEFEKYKQRAKELRELSKEKDSFWEGLAKAGALMQGVWVPDKSDERFGQYMENFGRLINAGTQQGQNLTNLLDRQAQIQAAANNSVLTGAMGYDLERMRKNTELGRMREQHRLNTQAAKEAHERGLEKSFYDAMLKYMFPDPNEETRMIFSAIPAWASLRSILMGDSKPQLEAIKGLIGHNIKDVSTTGLNNLNRSSGGDLVNVIDKAILTWFLNKLGVPISGSKLGVPTGGENTSSSNSRNGTADVSKSKPSLIDLDTSVIKPRYQPGIGPLRPFQGLPESVSIDDILNGFGLNTNSSTNNQGIILRNPRYQRPTW